MTLSITVPLAGSTRLLAVASPVDGRGPFIADFGDVVFAGPDGQMTNHDPVMALGYNQGMGGIPIVPGEPGLAWGMEADYFDGARRTMEVYLQYISGQPGSALSLRPLFISIDRETHRVRYWQLNGDHISFWGDDGSGTYQVQMLDVQKGNLAVCPPLVGQTALQLLTLPDSPSIMVLTFGDGPGTTVGSDGPARGFAQAGNVNVPLRWSPEGVAVSGLLRAERANVTGLLAFSDNASALAGGLVAGDLYRLGDGVGIVH